MAPVAVLPAIATITAGRSARFFASTIAHLSAPRRCGTDDITAGILVESRRNKISQNSGRRRCRRDEPEVARMADVHAVRQKLLLKLFQNVLGRDTVLWQRLIKERPDSFRINVRR